VVAVADLTIAELRDMSPLQRAAHAAAQRQRLVLARLPEVGRVHRDDLVAQLHGWMGAGQIDETIDELILARQVHGLSGKGGYVQRAPEGDAS
jgi:hypothetical protein